MKTKEQHKQSVLERLREIRDKMSHDIQDMSFEELSEYLKNKKPLHPKWAKKEEHRQG